MRTFVRFHGGKWHIVAPGHELSTVFAVPTLCGEPSILTNREKAELVRSLDDSRPADVCERCEKRNP